MADEDDFKIKGVADESAEVGDYVRQDAAAHPCITHMRAGALPDLDFEPLISGHVAIRDLRVIRSNANVAFGRRHSIGAVPDSPQAQHITHSVSYNRANG